MKEEEISKCQIQEWYPIFKSISIRTIIHELPESFVEYLLDDFGTFLLPYFVTNDDAFPKRIHKPEDKEDFKVHEGFKDELVCPSKPPSFPELEMKVKESIEILGGAVFPKLNWSAPRDAAWISSSGTLRCTSFSEIVLLLRSSDSLVHDLCHAYDSCNDMTTLRPQRFFLALRKWYSSFRPEMEFRCFVCNQRLVGISQREVTEFYLALLESKDNFKMMIQEFYVNELKGKFDSESYTFDVYVTEDGQVKLIDFNPWGAATSPLLFTWKEFEEKSKEEGKDLGIRIIESQCGVRPGLNAVVPSDYLDTSSGSGWDKVMKKNDEE